MQGADSTECDSAFLLGVTHHSAQIDNLSTAMAAGADVAI